VTATNECPLCRADHEFVLWEDELLRVILVADPDYPGFCRIVLNRHIREMTDLPADTRNHVMSAVFSVEKAIRDEMSPEKINLASLGNQVPHLHWHVIPRFADDRHFPDPVWAAPRRDHDPRPVNVASLKGRITKNLNMMKSTGNGVDPVTHE